MNKLKQNDSCIDLEAIHRQQPDLIWFDLIQLSWIYHSLVRTLAGQYFGWRFDASEESGHKYISAVGIHHCSSEYTFWKLLFQIHLPQICTGDEFLLFICGQLENKNILKKIKLPAADLIKTTYCNGKFWWWK